VTDRPNVTITKTREPGITKRSGPRGDSWIVVLSVGSHADGTRKQIKRSFPTLAAAKDWKVKTSHERRVGSYIVPTREKVGDYLDRWIDGLRGRVKSNTILIYRQSRGRLSILHDVALADLTTPILHRAQHQMVQAGLSKSTIALTFRVLRIAINDAISDRLLPASPFVGFKGVSVPRHHPKRLTSEEVAVFLASIADDPHRALWEVAFETGMRFAELVSLRWTEVDLDRKTIAVIRTLTRTEGGQIVEGTPKSEAGVRTIAISDELAAVLVEHRRVIDEHARLVPGWNPLGLVFPAESGPFLGNKVVNDWLKEACDKAGVPRITLHGARHTSGSEQAAAGVPVKTITQRLGHSHPSMTLHLYIHPDLESNQNAADLIRGRLRGKAEDS
jgi:integrase